ncbi:MAG: RagB/SusD family nutrient uptake outer membrane protein [Pedobacter sp.]|uniref:RagB/SusD family nutrient uptake outer membrane protein n=1 Tax=Pedobacter sp. TaxID=1411316 RepID=UPI0035643FA0
MNTNFKNIMMLLAATALLTLSSCKKYLDYNSPSKLNLEQTFEDVNYTNSQVIGIYTKLAGGNGYGNQLSAYFGLGADDFMYRGNAAFDGGADYAVANYGVTPASNPMYNVYVQLYDGIERANIACKYIPNSNLYKNGSAADKAKMKRYYGEALSLRALYYSELIRNWGDVPGTFVPAADVKNQYLGNTDRDSTYDHIIDDLRMAAELVPWRDELPDYVDFRFTKGAIKALRARIALARGGYSLRNDSRIMQRRSDYQKYYQIAFEECRDIIDSKKHALNPVYENIFKTLHSAPARYDDQRELMFEVAMWGQINDSNIGSAFGLNFADSPSWGGAGGRSIAVMTYFYEFENGKDVRRDVTMSTYKVVGDAATNYAVDRKDAVSAINMNIAKFRKSWTAFNGTVTGTYGVNWPVIRYADVLLMYAEAGNELGLNGSITPLDALQQVQKRAYGSNTIPVTPTDKTGFFEAIVKERLLEFGGEGIRKYDLIRWNLLASKIAETRRKIAQFASKAPTANNPYNNAPEYIYSSKTTFTNGNLNTEAASLNLYGGVPNVVYFTPMTVTTAPSTHPDRRYWRQEAGSYDAAGVLTSTFLNDPNTGYVCKFKANSRELLPYSDRVISEHRGAITQNFGY